MYYFDSMTQYDYEQANGEQTGRCSTEKTAKNWDAQGTSLHLKILNNFFTTVGKSYTGKYYELKMTDYGAKQTGSLGDDLPILLAYRKQTNKI